MKFSKEFLERQHIQFTINKLKWLIFNFPLIENPQDDSDRMSCLINLYCTDAVKCIVELVEEIDKK